MKNTEKYYAKIFRRESDRQIICEVAENTLSTQAILLSYGNHFKHMIRTYLINTTYLITNNTTLFTQHSFL